MIAEKKVYQSKFGYHPISLEMSKKLRFINGVYSKAQHLAHSWVRWENKDVQNQVIRQAIRNKLGQKIGSKIIGKWEEPKVFSLFFDKFPFTQHRWGSSRGRVDDNSLGEKVIKASRQARTPQPSPEDVLDFPFSEEEIDFLFNQCKNWKENI